MHLWLKFYIQGRLVEPGKRPDWKASMSTFIVSAFWHGFYPFYYVMFFFAAIMNEVAKDLYKARYIFRFIPKELRPFIGNLVTMLALNYHGVMFNALTFENGTKFGLATYFYIFILMVVILAASRTLGLVKIAQKLEAKATQQKVSGSEEKKPQQVETDAATNDSKKTQ